VPDRRRHHGGAPRQNPPAPAGRLHLDDGNGIDAIRALRRLYGDDLPAILITADRSPHSARGCPRHDVQCCTADQAGGAARADPQWRVQRVAAAE